jgi:hypothetical protein
MSNLMQAPEPGDRAVRIPMRSNNQVVRVATEAAAGALVIVIAVVALYTLINLVLTVVIAGAVVAAIAAILWYAFLRKR